MKPHRSESNNFLSIENITARIIPEGRILILLLFVGLALGPLFAYFVFYYMGTVPDNYTISQFYSGIRIDLANGVWMAWAVVLAPYAIFQVARIVIWAIKAVKDSMAIPGQ